MEAKTRYVESVIVNDLRHKMVFLAGPVKAARRPSRKRAQKKNYIFADFLVPEFSGFSRQDAKAQRVQRELVSPRFSQRLCALAGNLKA